jgi:hypothetical protein
LPVFLLQVDEVICADVVEPTSKSAVLIDI